jgi:hypothetical protein
MLDVMAFRFAGRFNSTRRMLPERLVIISSIVDLLHQPDELLRSSGFWRLTPLPAILRS